MEKFHWINSIICSPSCLVTVLKSRRASKTLAKLIPLLVNTEIKITYEEMAKLLGYKTRAGAYKAIKLLINMGILEQSDDGTVQLAMEGIIFNGNISK